MSRNRKPGNKLESMRPVDGDASDSDLIYRETGKGVIGTDEKPVVTPIGKYKDFTVSLVETSFRLNISQNGKILKTVCIWAETAEQAIEKVIKRANEPK